MNAIVRELCVDSFAGGGGASTGITMALGFGPDIAINHDAEAIAMHRANHPETYHLVTNVWKVDPYAVAQGRPIGLLWASPDCFPAGTLVLSRSGYVPIEEVQVGDQVLTHLGRWRRVTETSSTVRPLITLRGHGHPGLSVSPEHPFYARTRSRSWNNVRRSYDYTLDEPMWAPSGELDRGWYWATPCSFPATETPEVPGRGMALDERLMWLAGRYLGDGWTRLTGQRAELVITCGKHEAEALRKQLDQWPRLGARAEANELSWHERATETAYQFTTNHRGLVTWLRGHFGHRAEAKGIPGWALGMPENLREALLVGYLSADGWRHRDFQEASTVSKALAFGLKALAWSLGKTVSVYLSDNSSSIGGRAVNARQIYKVRWRHQVDGDHQQTERVDHLEWAPIREQIDAGESGEVFNIGVDEDESYVVEGIVVHNCKHFSKAKGGKPVNKNIRDLAWVVYGWAKTVRPRVIMLENVQEWEDWGPLDEFDMPCKVRKGKTFKRFVACLRGKGYRVEWRRELVAANYGSPTTRGRLFLIARCDGLPIVWPEGKFAKPMELVAGDGRQPWRTAAECIDWSLPCYSIFITKPEARAMRKRYGIKIIRPLAKNTHARIARGVKRYVIECDNPFIVPITHTGDQRVNGMHEPHRTTTCAQRGEHALVQPFLTKFNGGATGSSATEPVPTVMSMHSDTRPGGAPHLGVVAPVIVGVGSRAGQSPERSVDRPGPTITATKRGQHAIAAAHLMTMRNADKPFRGADEPTHTATAGGAGLSVVSAGLINTRNGEREGQEPRVRDTGWPAPTATAKGSQGGVAVAHLVAHYGPGDGGQDRSAPAGEPVRTITADPRHSVVTAYLAKHNADRAGHDAREPVPTVMADGAHHGVVAVETAGFLGQQNTDMVGHGADEPVSTIVQKGCTQTVVQANIISLKGSDRRDGPADAPAPAQCAGGTHTGVVGAFVQRYFGTDQDPRLEEPVGAQTTKDRTGVVEVRGDLPPLSAEQYERARMVARFLRRFGCWDGGEIVVTRTGAVIVDIGMRMLTPRELFRAQGFPDSYIIDHGLTEDGAIVPLTKTAQIRLVGNSVCPQVAAALVEANYRPREIVKGEPEPFRLVAAE